MCRPFRPRGMSSRDTVPAAAWLPAVTGRSRSKPLWEPGLIPTPGVLLEWRDSQHLAGWQDRPCVLCGQPTPRCSHYGEPVHKACAENGITAKPIEGRLGRFASALQPARLQASAAAIPTPAPAGSASASTWPTPPPTRTPRHPARRTPGTPAPPQTRASPTCCCARSAPVAPCAPRHRRPARRPTVPFHFTVDTHGVFQRHPHPVPRLRLRLLGGPALWLTRTANAAAFTHRFAVP